MKKKAEDTTDLQPMPDGIQEIARIIPIRTETAINQFPFYRLSKGKEPVRIAIVAENKRGKVSTRWEVSANQKYGHPGSLAYKLDTLLINRLIDEARPNVPEILKLGSLRDIAEELNCGKDTNLIKKALHQNASAYITADLLFQGNDGTEKEFKFGATRYEVIFYGEKLPNGKRADAVYIVFHRSYHDLLSHARTRPLDYGYLKELPPSSQRLYELIAPQIFSALKNDNPRAKYLYSEFCQRAPLTRYHEWEDVKKQLYKVHRPHKESGYLKAVEFEETVDASGVIDWVMWYTPGRKAKAEFKRFNTKEGREIDKQQRQRPRLVEAKEVSWETGAPERTPEDSTLIEKLMNFGIDAGRAARLVENDRAECALWVDAWPHQNQGRMENPPAVLISFIEKKRRPLPKGYRDAVENEQRRKEREQQQVRQMAEELHFQYFAPVFRSRLQQELLEIERARPDAYKAFKEHFDKKHAKGLRAVESEDARERITIQKAMDFFSDIRPELAVRLTTFDEWNETENRENSDPVEWFNSNPEEVNKLLDQ
jgi:hypothetical protein